MKKKIFTIFLFLMFIFIMTSCKKRKRGGKVLGSTPSEPVSFGVHPERGSNDDEIAYLVSIYVPTGSNKNGVQKFKKEMYELEELTPKGVDAGLKYFGVISEDSVFCDLRINDSGREENAGPGANQGAKIRNAGLVRYVIDTGYDLQSDIVNEEDYESVKITNFTGRITTEDIVEAITKTFKENFQLVSCELGAVSLAEYKSIHPQS